MNKKNKSSDIANRYYEPNNNNKHDEISASLAATHELVNDSYMMGDIQQNKDERGEKGYGS